MRRPLVLLLLAVPLHAQDPTDRRFDRTDSMVPMRDGVKLFTRVFVPKEAKEPLPILLLRTPYGIDGRAERQFRNYLRDLVDDGYVFAFQDIRGRYRSDGTFVMTRPPRNTADPNAVDEASDTQDTIDWLLKNVKNHNGRVGMLGISYDGWLTAVAMLDPHPALKAVSPQASPVDMFLGDDFHHNGAFRLSYGFEYVAMMETDKTNASFKFDRSDTYEWYLNLGALSNVNAKYFHGKMPTWNDFVAHPNYDDFWKKQSLEPRLTKVTVPTLNVAGWFDQEDFRGPLKIYELLEKHDNKGQNFLAVGPWNHGGWSIGPGDKLGKVAFDGAAGKYFRSQVQAPFFAKYLKDRGPAPPEALMFLTGANRWAKYDTWPPKGATARKLYFQPNGKLAFDPPPETPRAADEYLSDPAKPVPYRPRPVTPTYPGREWKEWMVEDQRFTHQRPDVLTYESEPLTEDLVVAGPMTVRLFAATSGTDSDWIVRLIDAYPEDNPDDPEMGGFQQLVIGEPVRARFRKSMEKPEAVTPNAIEEYTIDLHWGHHRFRKGHRVMVQVSSTWFPLIDRNPQTFVPNIFEAKDADFRAARQRVYRSPRYPSHVALDVLK
ncbi:MAG TPA: CocE/NonD family hydrolase [Gemmataceae bacterium]|nr:CocE/NonD family hydrolase [Gemmataceae bacterium]